MLRRPNDESNRKGCKVGDIGERIVARRIEFWREDGGEAAENIEVIPLDHRPDCGRQDNSP